MKTNTLTLIKNFIFTFLIIIIFGFLSGSNTAQAYITPTFSFTQPNSYSAKISVYGDPDSTVTLHYGNLASLSNNIGSTNENGSLTVSVSSSSYGISCGNTAYISINGIQSPTIPWSPVDSTCDSLSLNRTSLSLSKGQSTSISATDNINISIASTSNSSVVNSNTIGGTIYITAANIGTTNLIICAENNTNLCKTVLITVSTTGTSYITFSQNNIVLAISDSQSITMSGSGTGSYYIASNSNPTNVTANIADNIVTLHGLSFGSSTINICQNNGGCGILYVSIVNVKNTTTTNVVSNVSTTASTTTVATTTTTTSKKIFITNLKLGSKGAEVSSLQNKLKTLKFYSGIVDGKFGASTQKAVKAFQKAHNLEQVGSVGPKTRALLNK